jgi:hypothetical protein
VSCKLRDLLRISRGAVAPGAALRRLASRVNRRSVRNHAQVCFHNSRGKIHDVFTAITDKLFFCSSGVVRSRTGSVHRVHDS